MQKFHFVLGEFCAEGMSRNYIGYGAKFIIIFADSYSQAEKLVNEYGESIFGKQEVKDMWYGEMHKNWKATSETERNFAKRYHDRFNTLLYHQIHATKIFNGSYDIDIETKKCWNNFIEKYPILIIDSNGAIIPGSLNDVKLKERSTSLSSGDRPEDFNNIEYVPSTEVETDNDKEFFGV